MIRKLFYLLSCTIFISSCGFKIIDESKLRNFDIISIETLGDNRINFILSNSLKIKNDQSKQKIKLELNTKKIKEVKERNIKNEITKYSITIQTKVNYFLVGGNMKGKFSILKTGSFNLAEQYSQSMSNEKKLIETLSSEIQKEIINSLIIIFNDL